MRPGFHKFNDRMVWLQRYIGTDFLSATAFEPLAGHTSTVTDDEGTRWGAIHTRPLPQHVEAMRGLEREQAADAWRMDCWREAEATLKAWDLAIRQAA